VNWVDILVVTLAVIAGISGARQGMVTALASLSGVLLGAILGVRLAPALVERFTSSTTRIALTVAILVLLVAIGETVGVWAGRAVRERMHVEPVRQVDSALGTVVLGLAVFVVAWLVAVPLTAASSTGLASAVNHSLILGTVDKVMPSAARQLPADLRRLLRQSGFPDVLGPFAETPNTEVEPPDRALQSGPIVRQLQRSVLKVRGRAPSCGRALEGTGFVIAPERVMTNAHVVAGTEDVRVETQGGGLRSGRVVLYDPETDVAVLAVPGLEAQPLQFAPADAETGASAIVLGYPLDGPYQASEARVRERIELRGPDIYESQTVLRDVYTVRAVVRSGNSGGPMVDPQGRVLGVVFGAAVDDDDTGFVLTADEVADEVASAGSLSKAVSTSICAA
jgi:S1-C subfamily serine protease